ncbi:esterase [Rhizobium altiplani]|uniref:Esterase n=2 Tax=Rhizobium TaxID=379 RepID=A0A120FJG0_9HYPH|nr:esterase [Rhizobium altiplani]KWV49147.1 esterase [Rhizobium altiplani]KWV58860.1 esterase [Rhizobium altiplani]CCM80146.1 Esterase protein [Rhizobium mesoamericanum STM3625]
MPDLTNDSFIRSLSGASLNVVSRGNHGLPVLFQHGLGGDAHQVARIFPDDERFALTTIECAGHGGSSCPQPRAFSIEAFYQDMEAYSAGRFPHGFVVGGISMGAALALALAIRNPSRVHGLILVRPAWFLDKSPDNLEPIRAVGELLRRYPRKKALEIFVSSDLAARIRRSSPDNYSTLTDYLGEHQPEWLGKLLSDIAGDGVELSTEQLAAIKVPTLVIGVDADDIHPFTLAEKLHRLIPGSRFEKAPRKDDVHAKPSYAERTAELILGFLGEIEEPTPDRRDSTAALTRN